MCDATLQDWLDPCLADEAQGGEGRERAQVAKGLSWDNVHNVDDLQILLLNMVLPPGAEACHS